MIMSDHIEKAIKHTTTKMDRVEKIALVLILLSAAIWAPDAHRMIAGLVAPSDLEQRVKDLEQIIGDQR